MASFLKLDCLSFVKTKAGMWFVGPLRIGKLFLKTTRKGYPSVQVYIQNKDAKPLGFQVLNIQLSNTVLSMFSVITNPIMNRLGTWSQTSIIHRKRFGIETLFGDLKSRGFNIHKSKLRHPERLEKLLIAVCLAFIFTILAGVRSHQFDPTWLKKIFRQDQHKQFSIFSKGKMIWDFFLFFHQFRPPNFKELLLNLKSVRLWVQS